MNEKNAEKIMSLVDYTTDAGENARGPKSAQTNRTPERKNTSALIPVLVVAGLLGLFYFLLGGRIGALRADLALLSKNVSTLDNRVEQLENLPARAKQMALDAMVQETTQKAAFLSAATADPRQKENLDKALESLRAASAPAGEK